MRITAGEAPRYGHWAAVAVIGALAMLFLTAGKASASEPSYHWYSCTSASGAEATYEDAACSKKGGANHYAWSLPTSAVPVEVQPNGIFTLKSVVTGISVEFSCSSGMSGSAEVANAIAGPEIANASLKLKGCGVTKPAGKGCVVKNGEISLSTGSANYLSNHVTVEGIPYVEFSFSVPGTSWLGEWQVEKCSVSSLNRLFRLEGSFRIAVMNESGSKGPRLIVTQEQSEGTLKVNGFAAVLNGIANLGVPGGRVKIDTAP